ncbi:MAG TPA: NAD-dependent epimerase/dehydratase family protein [Sandaracinaceae bacterium]
MRESSVLITGGAGFIGSRLARYLAEAGHRVVVADNLTATRSLVLLEGALDRVEFVHLDVRCPEDFDRLPRGPWHRVYHLAASFANALSVEQPLLDARTNVDGTLHVLRYARQAGCELFVYTGSSSSYGDVPVPFEEDGPMRPATPYATTKLAAETHVRASGLSFAIFRLFNVYGPGDLPGPYRNAIPNMAKALDAPDGVVRLFGEGATRDFTYVDDVVDVLARPEPARGQVVNVGTGVETPVEDVAVALLRAFDLPLSRLQRAERREWDRVVRRVAAVDRLRALYGRVPSTPLEVGLPRALRWLAEAGHVRRTPVG